MGRRTNQTASAAGGREPVVAAVVAVIVGVAPVVWDPRGFQAFLHPKILLLGLGLAAGGLLMARGRAALPASPAVRVVAGLFLAWAVLAAVSSDQPWVATLGSSTRQMGVLMWLAIASLFVVGLSLAVRNRAAAETGLIVGSLLGVTVVSVMGVLEAVSMSPFDFGQTFGARVQGVFGNPAMLAGYLILTAPVLAAVVIDAGRPIVVRSVAATVAALAGTTLVLTGTRSAWLGIAAAGAVWITVRQMRRRLVVPVIVAVAVLTVGVLGVVALTGRASGLGDDLAARTDLWTIGLRGVADQPLVGAGPEGFPQVFAANVTEAFVIEHSREQIYDRAHNGLIDVAVATGVPGGLMYALLLAAVVLVFLRSVVGRRGTLPMAGLGILAYLVHQAFYFPVGPVDGVFWLMAGIVAASVAPVLQLHRLGTWLGIAVVGVGIVLAGYAALGVAADRKDREAVDSMSADRAFAELRGAARLRPVDDVHYSLASSLARNVDDPALVEEALAFVTDGRRFAPDSEVLILAEVDVLLQSQRLSGSGEHLEAADDLLGGLVARDPFNGQAYLRMGTSAYLRGDFPAARWAWLEAARLMPSSDEVLTNLALLDRDEDLLFELQTLELDQERLRLDIVDRESGSGSAPSTLLRPAPGAITSFFGERIHPIDRQPRVHTGIDFALAEGDPITAAAAGTVILAGPYGGYGLVTVIDHGGGLTTVYAHQREVTVTEGTLVAGGSLIGRAGSTGISTGPHLHFEVRLQGEPVDPLGHF